MTTTYGVINMKIAQTPGGEINSSPEYEDCRKLAIENQIPLKVVYQAAIDAWHERVQFST